jgi:hypothetical protein
MKLFPVDFSGGVNLLRDRRYIGENELSYAKNFVPTKSGLAGKRLSRGLVLGSNTFPVGVGWPYNLGLYIADVSGVDFVAGYRTVVGTQIAGLQAFSYSGGSALAAYAYTAIPQRRPQGVNFDHKMYFVAGPETGISGLILQVNSGGVLEFVLLTFTTAQSTVVLPRMLAAYRRRMVYADFGPNKEDWIVFSDFQAPTVISADVLATNGRNFRLGGTPGRITAIREAMLTSTGTPTETVLLAFKERSMYIIQGEPGQTTDTTPGSGPNTILGDLVIQRVNTNAGCSSPETIVQTPYGLLWAGPDDVWLLREGQVPTRVGTKIRPILEATPADKRYLWHASYFNGFYRLSLFSEGQGPGEDSPCGEQWWLDLRDGLENGVKWWGPMVYKAVPGAAGAGTAELTGVRMQALDERDGRQPQLLSLEGNYIGQSYLHTYDVLDVTGRDGVATVAGFSGPVLPSHLDDSEIEVEVQTSEADHSDPGTDKVYQGTELSMATTEATYIEVETHFDGGARVTTNEEVFGQTGFGLDITALDTPLLTREFKAQTVRPTDGTRPRGKTIQQRIRDRAGYVVDETCNRASFIIQGTNAAGGAIPAFAESAYFTVPSGYYASIDELYDAICLAMGNATLTLYTGAAIPGFPTPYESFFTHNQGAPRTSATPTITLDPNGNYTLAAWALTWAPIPFLTLDMIAGKLAGLMGFDAINGNAFSGQPFVSATGVAALNADMAVFAKRSAHFELNNIFHDIVPMYRRPL